MGILDYSTNPANNGVAAGITYWPEGMLPGQVNDTGRQMMADLATWLTAPTLNGPTTINGAVNATGAITQAGNQVWHAGNFSPSGYAALSGATFTGGITAAAGVDATTIATQAYGSRIRASTSGPAILQITDNGATTEWARFSFNSSGQATWTGTGGMWVNGPLTQQGNQVWHAGNFSPSNYALLSGATFTGAIGVNGGITSSSDIVVSGGDITAYRTGGTTGAIYFNSAKTRYIYNDSTNVQMQVPGGTLTVNGSAVWTVATLTPSNYASLSGAAFTGPVSGSVGFDGTTTTSGAFGLRTRASSSGPAIIQFTNLAASAELAHIEVVSGKLTFYIGGTAVASIDSSGNIKALGNFSGAQSSV